MVLNADGTKRNFSRILAFKIGGNDELPPMPDVMAAASPPESFGSESQINTGARLYTRSCAGCHGIGAISGGVLPDLRYSAMTSSAEAFRNVVLEGALLNKGMAGFAEVIDADDAEAVRAFVVSQANQ
ncbi:MAG: c-type cytochrome [Woeseiaceae bacterium]|nr:c-type cytochrome [Woeseiaceae bacterium]